MYSMSSYKNPSIIKLKKKSKFNKTTSHQTVEKIYMGLIKLSKILLDDQVVIC